MDVWKGFNNEEKQKQIFLYIINNITKCVRGDDVMDCLYNDRGDVLYDVDCRRHIP